MVLTSDSEDEVEGEDGCGNSAAMWAVSAATVG